MFNFFVNETDRNGDAYYITGSDVNHIKNVLRMSVGQEILVSCNGKTALCSISHIDSDTVTASIIDEDFKDTSLPVDLYLFQGLPKSDKLELIIQKAVELGAAGIIPVEMSNCVVKLDDKKKKSKVERWQAIAESAAKQSKRSVIPKVFEVMSYKQALQQASELDLFIVPYENADGMKATREVLTALEGCKNAGILIGPEGGFDPKEIDLALENGAKTVSLGKRILRTETAAIAALSMCMLHIEMNVNGEKK